MKTSRKLRVLCLLLFMFMVTSIFTGCKGNSPEPKENTGTQSGQTNKEETSTITYTGSAPIAKETVKLSMLTANGLTGTTDFKAIPWVQQIVKKANVELNVELIDQAAWNDVKTTRLASGSNLPDIMKVGFDENMVYTNSNLFIDLSEYYDKYGFNLNKRLKDNPTAKAQLTTPEGKIVYVPVINMTQDYTTALSINTMFFKKLGLKAPTTVDELYNVMKAIKTGDPNGNGKADEVPFVADKSFLSLTSAFWGIDVFSRMFYVDDKDVVQCSYTGERYKEFLKFWNTAYKEGLLYNEFASLTTDKMKSLYANNLVGINNYYHNTNLEYSQLIKPDFNPDKESLIMSVIPPLKGPYGDQFYYGNTPVADTYAITKDCKTPELAFCFLDYLYSDEATDMLYLGVEGVDYKLENGKPVIDLAKRNNGDYADKSGYNFGGFPRILLAKYRDINYCPEIAEGNKLIRQYVKVPIINSYASQNELEVTKTYLADMKTFCSENMIAFITGTKDLSQYDKYTKELESLHVKELTAVYQTKYDRFKSALK